MPDLEAMQPEDARTWYWRWYAPNNAYLVVGATSTTARCSATPSRPTAPSPPASCPPAASPRTGATRPARLDGEGPAELPYLAMAWHVPALRDPANDREAFALDVLAAVLDGYDGARLTCGLVRDQRIAVSVGASYDTGNRGPALFYLHGVPAAGHQPEALAEALRAEASRIADEGISAAELALREDAGDRRPGNTSATR